MKIEDNKKYRVRILMPFKCKKCGVSGYYPNWPNVTCTCGVGSNDLVEAECVSGWYHRVPSVSDPVTRATIRKYRTFLCNIQGVARGGKRECQADLCGKLDPMFKMLTPRDQKRKRGGVDVDSHLGITPQHIITVYSYDEAKPMVLKFGNDLRSEFVRIITAKNSLAGRDIIVWREKNNNQTTYKAEAQDPSTFSENVDYGSISFDAVLAFENVDPVKAWEFVSTGRISGEGESSALPVGEQPKALAGGFPTLEDIAKYQQTRALVVDVGKRYIGRTFGHLIDNNESDYFKWLVNTSNSPEVKAGAEWVSILYTTGNIQLLISAVNNPEPGGEPGGGVEPEPPMKVSYAEVPSSTGSARVDAINKVFEEKFAGKPDKEMIAFLSGVYGQWKNVTELSIASWPEEKLNALVEALAKI
jgi:hypothetical protein